MTNFAIKVHSSEDHSFYQVVFHFFEDNSSFELLFQRTDIGIEPCTKSSCFLFYSFNESIQKQITDLCNKKL